jgi:response regulator RpfG family c-di-GMP phosphodiesterase
MFKKNKTLSNQSNTHHLPLIKILIADDEPEIHTITKIVLANFHFENRKLAFLSAYSGAETIKVMRQHQDIAVILLDVVMEEDDSGLKIAKAIREELDNHFIRIILRTGQPGQAPKEKVIVDYDINDYREKTELDNKTMFCMMYSAIRSYHDIMNIEKARLNSERHRKGLENILEASTDLFQQKNLKQLACGLLLEMSILLQVSNDALLIRIEKKKDNQQQPPNINIMAASGIYENYLHKTKLQQLPKKIIEFIQSACEQKRSFIKEHQYVGYFSNQGNDIHLLYLGDVNTIDSLDKTLINIYTRNVEIAFENLLMEQEIISSQSRLLSTLANTIETRCKENSLDQHVDRVAHISKQLAIEYGLDSNDIDTLFNAAPLHDIGKIAIPESLLLKPNSLDANEWKIMQTHTTMGAQILGESESAIIQAAVIIAEQHHEKYDGTGYPSGLKNNHIHIYARIVALADVYDALTHQQVYKLAWSHDQAMSYINKQSGTHFDPQLVTVMNKKYPFLKEIIIEN